MNQGTTHNGLDRPALLVSIHDVSPLTLETSRRAVELVHSAGVPLAALTVLVVPRHEDRLALDEHTPTRDWLNELARDGAHLVMHGYTHRMPGRTYSPLGLLWAYGFARGQGEFYRFDREETKRRLALGRAILERAGLGSAITSFVPPAWLLSKQARAVVRSYDFDWYEELGGIVTKQGIMARRLIGWGSLNLLEVYVTTWWAAFQRHRRIVDTRLAIHPIDMNRKLTVRSIRACLSSLLPRTTPFSYRGWLATKRTDVG
jgi:predicted deacetylase